MQVSFFTLCLTASFIYLRSGAQSLSFVSFASALSLYFIFFMSFSLCPFRMNAKIIIVLCKYFSLTTLLSFSLPYLKENLFIPFSSIPSLSFSISVEWLMMMMKPSSMDINTSAPHKLFTLNDGMGKKCKSSYT